MATAIPSTVVPTGNTDAGTDSPASARADINTLIVAYNQLIAAMVGGSTMYSDENDGTSSGLDAGTLDGQAKAFFQSSTNQTTGTLPLNRLPATLTGKDADTLDGQHGTYYRDADNLNAGTVPEARLTAGSTAAKGIVELSTAGEMTTGTSTTLVPPVKEVVDYIDSTSQPLNNEVVAKAWVDFNGTGTVAINADYNVGSITDNATGDFTINFTTAMADANYSLVGTAGGPVSSTNIATVAIRAASSGSAPTLKTTTAVRIVTPSSGAANPYTCGVTIFGN